MDLTERNATEEIARERIASGKDCDAMALRYHVGCQQARTRPLRYKELREAGLENRREKRKKDQEPKTELERAQIEVERSNTGCVFGRNEARSAKRSDEGEKIDDFHN